MLLIIDKSMIHSFENIENVDLYNFNTLYEGLGDLTELFMLSDKFDSMDIYGTQEFDQAYASMVIRRNDTFKQMYWIMYGLYKNRHVVIAVDFDNHGEYMIEALTKLIQQRYEYNATYVYEDEDIPALEDNLDEDFGITGLFNLDNDRERFLSLVSDEELSVYDQIDEHKKLKHGNK